MKIETGSFGRWTAFPLLFLLAFTTASATEVDRKYVAGCGKSLVVGFTPQVFYNVDPRDAMSSARTWIEIVDRNLKNPCESRVVYFSNPQETESALTKNEVDIIVMISEDFVRLRDNFDLVPALSSDYGKRFYDELILLVRDDSGITRLAQLRGKRLRVEGGQKGSVPLRWLDSLLLKRFSVDALGFFSDLIQHPKANQSIMPVFFGQADACLASSNSFEIMNDLNPQIGRRLRILERSPGFATGVIAVRSGVQDPRRDAMIRAFRDMESDPKGRQLLTMFRINRLVPFRVEHLTSVEKVLKAQRGNPGRRK